MRADFGIGPRSVGRAQMLGSAFKFAQAELDPAQAVGDEGVARRELKCALDELLGFGQAHTALSQRVAQRVVRVRVVGLHGNDPPQQPLGIIRAVEFLGHHGLFVEQIRLVRKALAGLAQHLVGITPTFDFTQHAGFGDELGARIVGAAFRRAAHRFAGLADAALARLHGGAARLHIQCALGVVDAREPALGTREIATLFG